MKFGDVVALVLMLALLVPTAAAVVQVESFDYSKEVNLNSDGWFMVKLNSTVPTDVVSDQTIYVTVYDNKSVLRDYCKYEDYYTCARYETTEAGIGSGHFFIDDVFVVGHNYTIQIEVAENIVTGEVTVVEMRGLDFAGDWLAWTISNLPWLMLGIILLAAIVLVIRYIVA